MHVFRVEWFLCIPYHTSYPCSYLFHIFSFIKASWISAVLVLCSVKSGLSTNVTLNGTDTNATGVSPLFYAACGGDLEGSDGCVKYLFNETRAHYQVTDYVKRENSAIEDASEELAKEWSFIVSEFARLEPVVANFTSSGGKQMSTLITELAQEVSAFANVTNPLMEWVDRASLQLTDADATDMAAFSRESDKAIRTVLDRAMTAAQLRPHDQSMVTGNSTLYVNKFWEIEFSRVRSVAEKKQADLLAKLHAFQDRLLQVKKEIASKTSNISARSLDQKLVLNVTLPNFLTERRNSFSSGLANNVTRTFNGTSAVWSNATRVFEEYANATLGEVRRQFNNSLDALGAQVEGSLTATNNSVINALSASQALFYESQAGFGVEMDYFARMLAAAANSSEVDQSQTNEFVMTDADLGNDSIYAFRQAQAAIAAGLASNKTDRDERVKQIEQAVKAYAAQVLWKLEQDMLVFASTADTVQSWKALRQTLESSELPGLTGNFSLALGEIKKGLATDPAVAALRGVNVSADPRVQELLRKDYSFVAKSDLEAMANSTDAWKVKIFDAVTAEIQSIVAELNASGNALAIKEREAEVPAKLKKISDEGAGDFAASQSSDALVLADMDANIVQAPANAELARVQKVQARVAKLMDRLDVLSKSRASLTPIAQSTSSDIASAVSTIKSSVMARDFRLTDAQTRVMDNARHAIDQYVTKFVADLPESTGFEAMVNNKAATLESLRQFIKTEGTRLASQIAGRAGLVNQGIDLVGYTNGSLKVISDLVAAANTVPFPIFSDSGLSGNSLNVSKEVETMTGSVAASVAAVKNSIAQKSSDLVAALHDQKDLSTARDAQLTKFTGMLAARNESVLAIVGSQADKVAGLTRGINESFANFAAEAATIGTANRAQFGVVNALLSEEVAAAKHQVGEAVPEFLFTYEKERIAQLLESLDTLNSTIKAISQDAMGSQPGSLLHQAETTQRHGSASLVRLLADMEDREDTDALSRSAKAIGVEIEAIIENHHTVNVSLNVDLNATTEFANSLRAAIARADGASGRTLGRVANATLAREALLDAWSRGNSSALDSELKPVRTVLAHASAVEAEEVRGGLAKVDQARAELDALTKSWASKSIKEVSPVGSADNLTSTEFATPTGKIHYKKVKDLQNWLHAVEVRLNEQLAGELRRQAVVPDRAAHDMLESLIADEKRIEDDFKSKVVSKLRRKNTKLRERLDAETHAITLEVDAAIHKDVLSEIKQKIRR